MPNSFQENNTTNTFFGHWLLQFIKSHWTKSEITMSASPLQSSPIVKKSLDIYLDNKNRRNYLKWGFINAMILSVLMYDIKNKCPFSYSNWYYVEYVTAGLLAFSVLYYFTKFLFIWLTFEPIKGTQAQQKLLHFEDGGKYQFQSDSHDSERLKFELLFRFIVHCTAAGKDRFSGTKSKPIGYIIDY